MLDADNKYTTLKMLSKQIDKCPLCNIENVKGYAAGISEAGINIFNIDRKGAFTLKKEKPEIDCLYEGFSDKKNKTWLTFAGWIKHMAMAVNYFTFMGVMKNMALIIVSANNQFLFPPILTNKL